MVPRRICADGQSYEIRIIDSDGRSYTAVCIPDSDNGKPAPAAKRDPDVTPVQWFRRHLRQAGLHSKDVAEALGLSAPCVSMRVQGNITWTFPEVIKTCELLGVSLDEFAAYFGSAV